MCDWSYPKPVLPVIKFTGVFSQRFLEITAIRAMSKAQVWESNRPGFESEAAIN